MNAHQRIAALERRTPTTGGPYQKEPPPPEWWDAFDHALTEWLAWRDARRPGEAPEGAHDHHP